MTFYGIEAQQSNNTRNRIHLGIEHEFDWFYCFDYDTFIFDILTQLKEQI